MAVHCVRLSKNITKKKNRRITFIFCLCRSGFGLEVDDKMMVQSIENPRLYISNCHISIWMRNRQILRMNRRHVHLIKRNQSHVRSLSAISLFRTTFFKNQISRSSISRENISIERRERKKKHSHSHSPIRF